MIQIQKKNIKVLKNGIKIQKLFYTLNLNQNIKVAYPICIYSSSNIIKAINYILNRRNKKKIKKNILKFSKICDPKKWVLGFKQMNPRLF